MNSIEITSITGLTFPYAIYVCNVYEQYCVLLGTINTAVPPSITLPLPTEFQYAPVINVKVVASNGCYRFNIENC